MSNSPERNLMRKAKAFKVKKKPVVPGYQGHTLPVPRFLTFAPQNH